jgi:hypothetical protein
MSECPTAVITKLLENNRQHRREGEGSDYGRVTNEKRKRQQATLLLESRLEAAMHVLKQYWGIVGRVEEMIRARVVIGYSVPGARLVD